MKTIPPETIKLLQTVLDPATRGTITNEQETDCYAPFRQG